jgi:hypothetical protein
MNLLLQGEERTVSLMAAPRSIRLSHLATLNLMHAISVGDPGLLHYRLEAFAPARELLSRAVSVL